MKQVEIIKAYNALMSLTTVQLPVRYAYKIGMMLKKIEPIYQCGVETERKLIDQCGGIIGEGGMVTFPSSEDRDKFVAGVTELYDMEIDPCVDVLEIPCSAFGDQVIQPQMMMDLDGVLNITDA